MTTIVMHTEEYEDGSVWLTAHSDTQLTGQGSFVAKTVKVFTGDNYLIGGSGDAAVNNGIEAYVIRNPVMSDANKAETYEWIRELCATLHLQGLISMQGDKPFIPSNFLIATCYGVYEVNRGNIVNAGPISSIGSGSAAFVALHSASMLRILEDGSPNVLHEVGIDILAKTACTIDPKSSGMVKNTLLVNKPQD